MCVALAVPANVEVSKDTLRSCFIHNSDGAGYGFYKANGEQVLKKGYMTFNKFWEDYSVDREANKDRGFLVHFRIRTAGARDEANCHPFALKNGMMIHNGTVYGLGESSYQGKSDTAELAELISGTPKNKFDVLAKELKEVITWGAVVLLDKNGKFHFTLGGSGTEWIDGVFFSNTHWRSSYERNVTRYIAGNHANRDSSVNTVRPGVVVDDNPLVPWDGDDIRNYGGGD